MSRTTSRRGFVYTVFAIFILGLTFSIISADWTYGDVQEIGEKFRIDEVFYFLQSATDDLERASGIIGRRALTSMTNNIVTTGEYLDSGPAVFREAFENGTVNGTAAALMNQSTVKDWTASMQQEAKRSGYNLNLSLRSMDTDVREHLELHLTATYRLNLSDPITRARFDKQYGVNTSFSYEGIEDPLILIESVGRYTNFFASCPRDEPVIQRATGTDWFYDDRGMNWTSGNAVVRENNGGVSGVSDKGEKIAVVQDLCTYSQTTIENEFAQFQGVVSEQPAIDGDDGDSVDACGYTDVGLNAVVDDASGATSTTEGSMTVMTEEEVWQNDIQNWTERGCYVPDPWAPTIWGRMEGRKNLNGSYEEGLSFFLRIPELPAELQEANESAVAYVYFNESGGFGNDRKVKGVTNEDFSWFRLDQDHVAHWSMDALTYD